MSHIMCSSMPESVIIFYQETLPEGARQRHVGVLMPVSMLFDFHHPEPGRVECGEDMRQFQVNCLAIFKWRSAQNVSEMRIPSIFVL